MLPLSPTAAAQEQQAGQQVLYRDLLVGLQAAHHAVLAELREVVRLDREYIVSWSIELDIKILLKTILVVFKREGSV